MPMAESSKQYTAFVCPFGLFQFERMSQGLVNSLFIFQRLMDKCIGDMKMKEVLIFIDDLILHGKTLEETEERLIKTLKCLQAFGLKVDPKKCVFFHESVRQYNTIQFLYLYSVTTFRPCCISSRGAARPEKIEALTTWPRPKTVRY